MADKTVNTVQTMINTVQTMIEQKKGLKYSADYSANYTYRTLVDKVYIGDFVKYNLYQLKFFKILND